MNSSLTKLLASFIRLNALWRRRLGLSANEFLVLFQLWTHPNGELSMGLAGELVNVTSGGLTSIAARLERAGHVMRRSDPDDGRRTILCLTAAGRDARDGLLAPLIAHEVTGAEQGQLELEALAVEIDRLARDLDTPPTK